MVHAIHYASRPRPRPHPDAKRIAGISAAIAFNAALLLLLLVPMSAPPPAIEEYVPFRWVFPAEKKPEPPVRVPVTRPQTPTPQTVTQAQTVTPPVEQVVVEQGNVQADPAIATPVAVAPIEMPTTTGPLPGVRLEYANAPAPPYPREALRDGLEGTVLLQVLVDTDGRPLEVRIQQSSGHRQLDDAARRHVLRRWTFRPAMQAGRVVQAIGLVPIAFSLDR